MAINRLSMDTGRSMKTQNMATKRPILSRLFGEVPLFKDATSLRLKIMDLLPAFTPALYAIEPLPISACICLEARIQT